MSGPGAVLFWVGIALTGVAIGWGLVLALCALVRYLERHELAADTDEELTPFTDDARQARRAVESLCLLIAAVAIGTQL